MNPNEEQNNQTYPTFSSREEEIDYLLNVDDSEEEVEQKKSHIEDLESLTPEEREHLKNYLEYTKANIQLGELINNWTMEYNSPNTDVIRKREIEKVVREVFGEDVERAERIVAHIQNNGKVQEESKLHK